MIKTFLIALVALTTAGLADSAGALDVDTGSSLETADRLAQAGDFDGALAVYRALSGRQPDSSELHARIGGMLLLKQEYPEAITHFQKAIGRGPAKNAEAFIGLGIAYLHVGQYGPARAAVTEAHRLKPESAADLDQLLAWLDARIPGPGVNHR